MKRQQKNKLTTLLKKLVIRQWKEKNSARHRLELTIEDCVWKVKKTFLGEIFSRACWGTSFIMFIAIFAMAVGSTKEHNSNYVALGVLFILTLVCFFLGFRFIPKKLGSQTVSLYETWIDVSKRIKKLKLYKRIGKCAFWGVGTEEELADFFGYELKELANQSEKSKRKEEVEDHAKLRKIVSELYDLAGELGFDLPEHGRFYEDGAPKVWARGKKPTI